MSLLTLYFSHAIAYTDGKPLKQEDIKHYEISCKSSAKEYVVTTSTNKAILDVDGRYCYTCSGKTVLKGGNESELFTSNLRFRVTKGVTEYCK